MQQQPYGRWFTSSQQKGRWVFRQANLQVKLGPKGWLTEQLQPWKIQKEDWKPYSINRETFRMTKNNRYRVNNMCKKFIKACQVCSCINASIHTSRSPKSADRPDGLVYNKSQAGREALLLCSQLGTYHTGPMGPTSHNRVSELTQTPHQANQPQEISCLEKEHSKISQEITELLAKGAIVEAQLFTGSFIFQIFLVEKKGGNSG